MLKLRTWFLPKIALLILMGFVISSRPAFSQGKIVLIDTTDYLPIPEGINTNLAIASSRGYILEIQRLVELGAYPNYTDESGVSPLIFAVAFNQTDAVKELLKYEVSVDIATNSGETAIHIASKNDFHEIAEILIRDSADLDARDFNNCTPLHYASIYGYFYMTDMLLYYEAEVNAISSDGTSPLMAACWSGYADIVDLLLTHGADPNISDKKGFTALHIAAQNEDTLISKLLLNSGANISSTNKSGYDIGSIAARTGSEEYSKFIIEQTNWKSERNPNSIDPLLVARKFGKKDAFRVFKDNTSSSFPAISFDEVQISITSKINYDIYTGAYLSFTDPLHKFHINLGFEFKPTYTRVLEQKEENVFYQYHDKRYLFSAGIGKKITFAEDYFSGSSNFLINLNFGYLIANQYLGTNYTPASKLLFIPSAGFEKKLKQFSISGLYEYMNTGLYKAGPHWFKVCASYTLAFKGPKESLKNIRWY